MKESEERERESQGKEHTTHTQKEPGAEQFMVQQLLIFLHILFFKRCYFFYYQVR
jgi:hypothetical protein